MKKTKVSIEIGDPKTGRRRTERIEVDAWDVGVPGLVVHRHAFLTASDTTLAGKGWDVTQVESGELVTPYGLAKRDEAVLFAELLEPYADWTQPGREIINDDNREQWKALCLGLARQVQEVAA